jgi:hypothetical protein
MLQINACFVSDSHKNAEVVRRHNPLFLLQRAPVQCFLTLIILTLTQTSITVVVKRNIYFMSSSVTITPECQTLIKM